jgi:hypothetical protein
LSNGIGLRTANGRDRLVENRKFDHSSSIPVQA